MITIIPTKIFAIIDSYTIPLPSKANSLMYVTHVSSKSSYTPDLLHCRSITMAATSFLTLLLALLTSFPLSECGAVGVNWGRVADNLPPAAKVVELLKTHGLTRVKLYDADPTVLAAFANTNITVVVALPNELLAAVAKRPTQAYYWVAKNVAAHLPATRIAAVAVGNEVFVDPRNLTAHLLPAMTNVHAALAKHGLAAAVKVSTPIAISCLKTSYPPSAGAFDPALAGAVIKPILDLLRRTNSTVMLNAYPFFAYAANADVIPLDYAVFRPNPGVVDPATNLRYTNLLDAQIDAVYAAMAALSHRDVPITVSETGWPSKGDEGETGAGVANAAAYNGGLVRRVLAGSGTPMRPAAPVDAYLFALFNEDKKPGPTSERNYGLFYPSEERVYDVPFTAETVRRDERPNDGGEAAAGVSSAAAGRSWCIAKAAVGEERLQVGLDYACGEGGADCRPIQRGATCYKPNTVVAHASYAFNSYYQRNGRGAGTCYFGGAGVVVTSEPSYGKCAFPFGEEA